MHILRHKSLLAVAAALALAGCAADMQEARFVNHGERPMLTPEQRYPIEVVSGRMKLSVAVVSGALSAGEESAVRRYADAALEQGAPITISHPATVKGEVLAARIARLLQERGVAAARIRYRAVRGASAVTLSMRRKIAVTKRCGNRDKPYFGVLNSNRAHADFGCASQHNLAAMVANPEDFERPRPTTPAGAEHRVKGLERYYQKTSVTSGKGEHDQVSVKEAQ